MSNAQSGETPADEAWLAVLRGNMKTAATHPDTQLAAAAGWLIRARYNTALQQVRSDPDAELTRQRILARARASRRPSRSWLTAMAAASAAGLAAGIVGTLLLAPQWGSMGFPDVVGSQEVVAAPTPQFKSLSLVPTQREFVVRSRNVAATAARLSGLLTSVGADLRIQRLPSGKVELEIAPLASVPPALTQAAQQLKIDLPPDTPLLLTIESP
jgi:hypothetical protein